MQPTTTVEFVVPVVAPYDAQWVFGFLRDRALAGIERVEGLCYTRRIGDERRLSVSWREGALRVRVPADAALDREGVRAAVARMFDAGCDPQAVAGVLSGDRRLSGLVRQAPGLRVPGAWDGFETAVRAILGQQVSVRRARDLADRMTQRYGGGEFPQPEALAGSSPAELGMPGRRGQAITLLARAVVSGDIGFSATVGAEDLRSALLAIPGIGPWTAGYIAMRVARDPDAFLPTDWVVRKQLRATPAAALRLAESWRPWRAYAVMYLWWSARRGVTC